MANRVYIGNLPLDIRESELDDLFYKYGKIREIDLKTPARPPAFAFISFDDYRDAEDAIRGRDGYNFDGYRLRCEFAKGDRRGSGGGRMDDRREPRRGGGGRRTDYGVIVSNLPRGCSWQDLKDFMRKAGDVVFTDVDKHGDGVVEFSNRDDMEYAIRTLDDTEFKNYNDQSYIRVKPANKGKRDDSIDNRDDHKARNGSSRRSRDRNSVSPSRSRSRDRGNKRSSKDDCDDDYRRDSRKKSIGDDEDDHNGSSVAKPAASSSPRHGGNDDEEDLKSSRKSVNADEED